ncbi:MAG: PQQ-binding-like beta-propeller repeat protein, partial [Halobacteriota archaeon]
MSETSVRVQAVVFSFIMILSQVALFATFSGAAAATAATDTGFEANDETLSTFDFDGGDGSADNPYQIANWTDLDAVRDNLDSHFVLVADLNASTEGYDTVASDTANGDAGFDPIGENEAEFLGTFDGGNHTISNLTIDRETDSIGLFGDIGETGVVSDLTLAEPTVTGHKDVGPLAGQLNGEAVRVGVDGGTVSTGRSTGEEAHLGGLVGVIEGSGKIDLSYTSASVDANGANEVGGFAGDIAGTAEITRSYATGDVANGGDKIGGLLGDANSGATITETFAAGTLSGDNSVGGLVGRGDGGEPDVTNSYWDSEATGVDSTAGDGTLRTTTEMQGDATEGNMTGFDWDDTWAPVTHPEDDYPVFQWQLADDDLSYSNLTVTPTSVGLDEEITANATLTNDGDEELSYNVPLEVDGSVVDRAEGTLAADESTEVEFTHTMDTAGEKDVTIGDFDPKTVSVAVASSTAAGDWPEFGDDQTNDGNNSESTGPSEISGLGWRHETGTVNIYSSPVVVDGTVYIGAEDGFYAINTTDGTEEWHKMDIDLKNEDDDADRVDSPAYHDGYLYIGTTNSDSSTIRQIDASDGSDGWKFEKPGARIMGGATTVYNGSVYAADYAGTLWKINASTGDEEARFGTGGYNIQSEPAIADGYVYLGTDYDGSEGDSKFYTLDATDLSKQDEESIPNSVVSGPVVENETVYFGTLGGDLFARGTGQDLSSGPRVWREEDAFDDEIRAAPAVADGKLFVGSKDDTFRAFDVSDGSEQWSYDAGAIMTASPAYVDDTVYVGDWNGNFFGLNASTGKLNWEFPLYNKPHGIKSSPAVVNGSVYFGDYSGDVYKLDAPESGLPVSENFDSADEPDEWALDGDATWNAGVDSQETLRLTEATGNQFGAALYDRPFSSDKGIVAEFDYYADEGTGADGLSFFLVDGAKVHRSNDRISGAVGGALGYTQNETDPGVPNAYLGVGLDEYGNFATDGEGKDGGTSTEKPQNVVLRGSGDGGTSGDGYPFLARADVSSEFGETLDNGWSRVRITVNPLDTSDDGETDASSIRVEMSWDDGDTWNEVIEDDYTETPPDNLKLGFSGSTGGSDNVHAVDNLSVREPSDLSIDVTDASTGGKAGEEINFEYEVTNNGPNANDQITVTDDVTIGEDGLENYQWSYTTDGASAGDSGTGQSVGMELDSGETATVTVTADIEGSVTSDIEHNLTVDEGADFYDPTPGDLSAAHTVPIAASVDSGSYGTITEGDAVTLDASGSTGDIAFYEWDLDGDGNYERNETAAKALHTFNTPGTYTITLRGTTDSGATSTDTATITVDPTDTWGQLGEDATRTANNSDTASPTDLDLLWKFGEGKLGVHKGSAAVADGTVYTNHRETLYAIDADTGDEMWSVALESKGGGSLDSPIVNGSLVYVTDANSDEIRAYDTSTGSQEWSYTTDTGAFSIAYADDRIYFRDRGWVGALDATDGSEEWKTNPGFHADTGVEMTVGDGMVFLPGTELAALNASDGSTKWSKYLYPETEVILDNGTLYTSTRGDGLVALDPETGTERWSESIATTKGTMAVANGKLYRTTPNAVEARDVTDGSVDWSTRANTGPNAGGVAVGDGALYVTARVNGKPTQQLDFLIVDPADGSILGGVESTTYRGRAQFFTSPVVSDGTVYAGGNKGFMAFSGNLRPTADAGTDKTVEEDATVNFNASASIDDGSIDSYDWDFGDGNTATGETPSHTFDSAGTYTVELTVTDDEGATDTDKLTVTVKERSVLVAEIRNDSRVVVEDSTVDFTSDSYGDEGIAKTEWDFDGDGIYDDTGEDVTHTYADPGEYTVRMRVTDNAGSVATDTANVTVTDVTDPTADIADSSKTVDEDTPVTFDGSNSTDNDEIASYSWDFDGDG